MIEIRSFLNADLPHLADLWCIHHATYRQPPAVNLPVFQQAVVSRLFFEPARLLVATANDKIVAWCQWFPAEQQVAALAAICFHTDSTAENAVRMLLQHLERQVALAGMKAITVGVHFKSQFGYQGLEPVGHGFGVDVADDRTNTLLESAGYGEVKRIDRWEVNTTSYRAPVNRDVLAFRRSAKVIRGIVSPPTPETASAMVHLDVERHLLTDARTGIELAELEVWTSDPEALVMPVSEAILASWGPHGRGAGPPADIAVKYLISAVILQLAERRIQSLQRSVATDNTEEAATLLATNFSRTSAGRLLSKSLE